MGLFSFFKKNKEVEKEQKQELDKGLEKTRTSVFDRISKAIIGKSKVDDEVLDNLEEILVTSDVGVDTTLKIIERIQERVARDKYLGTSELNRILKEEIAALLQENNSGDGTTFDIPADKKQDLLKRTKKVLEKLEKVNQEINQNPDTIIEL